MQLDLEQFGAAQWAKALRRIKGVLNSIGPIGVVSMVLLGAGMYIFQEDALVFYVSFFLIVAMVVSLVAGWWYFALNDPSKLLSDELQIHKMLIEAKSDNIIEPKGAETLTYLVEKDAEDVTHSPTKKRSL